jgi:hypothetical protein
MAEDTKPVNEVFPAPVPHTTFEVPSDGQDKDTWDYTRFGHEEVEDYTQDEDGNPDPVSAKNDARADNGEDSDEDES